MSSTTTAFPANPYIGPRAFQASERSLFFGRERESRELADLLIAERIVLLHAPSGAGKTSLVRAGLLPRLEDDFDILPLARVGQGVESGEAYTVSSNRYVFSTLLSWEEGQAQSGTESPNLAGRTLEQYLSGRTVTGRPQLLVFDQFEELLTADPYDQPAKKEFFRQVASLLRRTRHTQPRDVRWALFVFREEYLAVLQSYFQKITGLQPETYRLDLLGPDAALAAIQNPARAAGVEYLDDAAQHLVDNLRRVRADDPNRSTVAQGVVLGAHVEPVQLQVVCFRLWEKLAAFQKHQIGPDDIAELADVDHALSGYYSDKLREISQEVDVSELRLRTWFNDRLITADGHRAIVQLDTGQNGELGERAISALLNTFLIRQEERRGLSWLELAHDRLIDPIRRDNERWFAERLQPFQLQASQWQRLGQPPELLLRGIGLYQAQRWESGNSNLLRPVDIEFLNASRSKVTAVDAFTLKYFRWWAYVATLGLIGVTLYAFFAVRNAERRRQQVAVYSQDVHRQLSETRRDAEVKLKIATDARNEAEEQADEAKEKLVALNKQKSDTEKELLRRLSAVLRVPMRSASALATARTADDAQKALGNWRELLEATRSVGGPDRFAPSLRRIEDTIKKNADSRDLPATAQKDLAMQTLRLAQSYGKEILTNLSNGENDLPKRLKEQLFTDARQVTEDLATSVRTAEDLNKRAVQKSVERFWQLYYGELPVVEGAQVARAMIDFGQALNDRQYDKLGDRAAALERACSREMRGDVEEL